MTANALHRWPPKSHLVFATKRGDVFFTSKDFRLDLADSLMLAWPKASRVVYLSLSTRGARWEKWDEANLQSIEDRIRYDLNFDGYSVSIRRVPGQRRSRHCTRPFTWRLHVRPQVSRSSIFDAQLSLEGLE